MPSHVKKRLRMSKRQDAVEIVSRLILLRPEAVPDLSTQLWESLAAELIPIIGEAGFAILYARSLHLTQSNFPWLGAGQTPQPTDSQFKSLSTSLAARAASEAGEACEALFATFIAILATLIGESLTNGILRAAWSDDASEITSKEFPS